MNLFKKYKQLVDDWRDFRKFKYIQEIRGSFIVNSVEPNFAIERLREQQKFLISRKAIDLIQENIKKIDQYHKEHMFSLFVWVQK